MASSGLQDRLVALFALITFGILVSIITLIIILQRRRLRRRNQNQNQNQDPNQNAQDLHSWGSDTPPIKFEDRKQTHADPKVFSWLGQVDADADRNGIFRTSVHADRASVWRLSREEMKDLDAALERLRGRDSVTSQRGSAVKTTGRGPGRVS